MSPGSIASLYEACGTIFVKCMSKIQVQKKLCADNSRNDTSQM